MLNGKSFQEWLIPQPIKLGGLGLRSVSETSPIAFLGVILMAKTTFFGDSAEQNDASEEWNNFLDDNSRSAREVKAGWEMLQREANGLSNFVDVETEGPLCNGV